MKRLIWLPIAGFLLIAGATVAVAAPALVDSARGLLGTNPQVGSPSTTTATDSTTAHPGQDLLTQVLADLVSAGTITQAQSDAITSGLQQAITDRQTQAQARQELIQGFIADGVITQDEINQLPADDPLRVAFDNIASNGQVTLDQLRGLGPGFGGMHDRPGGRMHGPGGFWMGPNADNDSNPGASPSPSTGSSNS